MEPLSATDPRVVGEFALRARLGSGGMGRVYLGFSPGGRAVAIKVVHPELARDDEFLRRFRQEVASARLVSGMYTAAVVGSGVDDDPPWLATAYVPGPPLAEVVNLHGPLSEAAVWRLAAGLADALRAVHGCGLVHRDLKPGNVLLAADGPHVIDFGISRAFEGTVLTSAGMVVGTPGYMSPEQAEGQQAGPPSDVFSLGCVLVYAATGNAPFGAGSAASVLYRVVSAEPDLGGLPASLRQVVTACLAKDPARRIGLPELTSMIAALGPPLPATIGSFWPEPLASIIAANQAPHPATQVGGSAPAGAAAGGPAFGGGPGGDAGWVGAGGGGFGGAGFGGAVGGAAVAGAAFGGPPSGAPGPGGAGPGGAGLGGAGLGGSGVGGPGAGGGTWMGSPGQAGLQQGNQGMAAGATGHAPMVADGYYAAAANRAGSPATPAGPAQTPYGQPGGGQSWPPQYSGQNAGPQYPGQQYPSGQQPASWQQAPSWPEADAVSAQPGIAPAGAPQGATPGGQYGAPSWPSGGPGGSGGSGGSATMQATTWPQQQPSSGGSWPGGGQAGGSGGGSYPSGGTPLAQYAPARRRPSRADLPLPVLRASRAMYLGAVVTALNIVFGTLVKSRYTNIANAYKATAANFAGTLHGTRATDAANHASAMAADIAVVVGLGGVIGVVCWLVVAAAARRGRGWTRVAALVLLALYTIGLFVILLGTHNDPTVHVTTVIIWVLGLAATIPLWRRQSRDFFAYYRQ